MERNCDCCEGSKNKQVPAIWVNPRDKKYGEALCDKCYQQTLKDYQNYKKLKDVTYKN